jgi:hypothetical protein
VAEPREGALAVLLQQALDLLLTPALVSHRLLAQLSIHLALSA